MEWQTILALMCVALAGVALIPRIVGVLRADRGVGCGSCGGCGPDHKPAIQKPLVGLKEIIDRRSP